MIASVSFGDDHKPTSSYDQTYFTGIE